VAHCGIEPQNTGIKPDASEGHEVQMFRRIMCSTAVGEICRNELHPNPVIRKLLSIENESAFLVPTKNSWQGVVLSQESGHEEYPCVVQMIRL